MPYEFLEELAVADVQFRAWGRDLAEVFTAAADATLNVMIRDLATIAPRETLQIELENEALDLLLFDFLQEFVYHKDTEQLLLRATRVSIKKADGHYRLCATVAGERLDPSRHEQGADVKAVTLHRFSLEWHENGWTAYVILDI